MTKAETKKSIAVMLHFANGGKVERRVYDEWFPDPDPTWNWSLWKWRIVK